MQTRRDFLKTLGALAAIAVLPKPLVRLTEPPLAKLFLDGGGDTYIYVPQNYALGFTISQELIEDDMYGPGGILGTTVERMTKAMPALIEQDLLAKHALISLNYDS